jgi:ribonucleoside-diphosphate reductase alpha chain
VKTSESQRLILAARYLRRDEQGAVVETPEEMCRRVARGVASAEAAWGAAPAEVARWEEEFYHLLDRLDFLPNSPTLINCGGPLGQLAACFVLPLEDDIAAIFETLKNAALIHKSGGGTGFDFSPLRPRGTPVHHTRGLASGPVSFMRVFNAATEEIRQGGVRRGANMGILRVDHPDIREFIGAKLQESTFRNFNLSVAVTDRFMLAVQRGERWPLVFGGRQFGEVEAAELFAEMAASAHRCGDPGLLFLDAINRANPVPALGTITATNPCGEQPLLPYESCTLGSINLAHMTRGREIDWDKLDYTVRVAVRFLDDVLEVNRFPLPRIARATRRTRKIGLGVMGWADMLFQLRVAYDSEAALELAEQVMGFVSERGRQVSGELARERGPFPAWKRSIFYPHRPLRNATVTTIAPTGSISALADTTSGIEPAFALRFSRRVLDNRVLDVVNRVFLEYAERELGPAAREAAMRALQEQGCLGQTSGLPPHAKEVFKTALEIAPEWHLRMQAAFQRHTDNAVSKTVNLPAETGVQQVAEIFNRAHALGLKGITVYRYGSRADQPLGSPVTCRACQ